MGTPVRVRPVSVTVIVPARIFDDTHPRLATCLADFLGGAYHCDTRLIDGVNIAEADHQSKPVDENYQLTTDD
jgi:hypothetical protein